MKNWRYNLLFLSLLTLVICIVYHCRNSAHSLICINIIILLLLCAGLVFFVRKHLKSKENLKEITLALVQSDKKFQTLFNDVSEAIILVKDGKYLDANDAAIRLFNYPNKAMFLATPIASVAPMYQPNGITSKRMVIDQLKHCAKEGYAKFEWLSQSFYNVSFWIDVTITQISLNNQTVLHLICRNINEKKLLQLELQSRTEQLEQLNLQHIEQKAIYQSLYADSSDGVSLYAKGKFIDCNNALLSMFNYADKEHFLSLAIDKLFPKYQLNGAASLKTGSTHLINCLKNGHSRFECLISRADASELWVELVLTRIKSDEQYLIHFVWRDISEKKQLEEININKTKQLESYNEELTSTISNLQEAQNQLVESEKMASLGSLVAGVAHEINTPVGISLTGITRFEEITQQIKGDFENNKLTQQTLKKYLDNSAQISSIISTNLTRASELVSSFKQIAVDQSSEEARTINLQAYVKEILSSLHSVISTTDVEIELICPRVINVTLAVGPLSQIITNLIMNSINHGFHNIDKGKIKIALALEKNQLQITYEDDGKGIPDENLPKIFNPFFTTSRERGGSGLGLNIIFNIVATTFKGSIHCDNKLEKGVRFTITFDV